MVFGQDTGLSPAVFAHTWPQIFSSPILKLYANKQGIYYLQYPWARGFVKSSPSCTELDQDKHNLLAWIVISLQRGFLVQGKPR